MKQKARARHDIIDIKLLLLKQEITSSVIVLIEKMVTHKKSVAINLEAVKKIASCTAAMYVEHKIWSQPSLVPAGPFRKIFFCMQSTIIFTKMLFERNLLFNLAKRVNICQNSARSRFYVHIRFILFQCRM